MFPSLSNRIVVLGGGFGGLEVIKQLKKEFGNSVEITLVDKKPYFIYNPGLFAFFSGRINKDNVIIPYKKLFEKLNVDLIQDKVISVSAKTKTVNLENSELKYDYLVVSLGSEVKFNNLPRAKDRLFTFKSYEDAIQIQEHIKKHFESLKKIKNLENQNNKLTFVVCGGGLTGVEFVAALRDLAHKYAKRYGIDRKLIDVTLIESDKILSELDRRTADYAERILEKMGVNIVLGQRVTRVDDRRIYLEDGRSISAETVIWCGGVMPVKALYKTDLKMLKDGGLLVNEHLQSVSDKIVYALGDNVHFEREDKRKVRRSFMHAIDKGKVVANNLIFDISNIGEKISYLPREESFIFRLGSYGGIYHGNNLFFDGLLVGWAKGARDRYNIWTYKRDFDMLRGNK